MDEVDWRYKGNIREALSSGNVNRLTELVPDLDETEAREIISRWQKNYQETMQLIRASQDTSKLDAETNEILDSLFERAHLSGYHR